ncbi:hypothetical protein INR49_023203 [Caranx melampygus]|nr:hypothetical protein INR49_023203 [Caranx melampygus]
MMLWMWLKAAVILRLVPGCGSRSPPVHGGGPAGDPEQQQPEVHRHQLVLGLAGPVLLVLVRTLYPVLQHMEESGQDVKDWQQVISVAVLDCAQEENFDVCKEFSIRFYPTFKCSDRQRDDLQSSVELLPLLGQRSDHFTAVIIEEPDSYMGREVILDLLQYSGVEKRLRFFFSSFLRTLPGVQRRMKSAVSSSTVGQGGALQDKHSMEPWRDFDRAKVYSADLESALHYLLRVELATHNTLEGEELKVFKDFVTLFAKLYPGGGSVVKLMETLSDWLLSLPLQRIPYQAVLDLVDNKMGGSRPGLRGYPCSLWTLFHVLTVQHEATPTALENTGLEGEAAPVLQVMRQYIRTFFGCEECGRHFEQAAAAGVDQVQNREQQILWLWNQHNMVNYRLAGSLSDDPLFPKSPWPSPALCASCHEEKNGVHVWNYENVLRFLRHHYGASNLSPKYSLTPPRIPPPLQTLILFRPGSLRRNTK